jgi:hypothetical protein
MSTSAPLPTCIKVEPYRDRRTGRKFWQVLAYGGGGLFPELPEVVWRGYGRRAAHEAARARAAGGAP